MEFSVKRVIIRRFFELLVTSAAISAAVTMLNISEILNTKNRLFFGLFAGVIIFVFLNVRMMRHCYFDLKNKRLYYFSNLAAYLLFAAAGFVSSLFLPNVLYTCIFVVTKFVKYLFSDIPAYYSVLIFHAIGLSAVFLAPLGMDRMFKLNDIYDD